MLPRWLLAVALLITLASAQTPTAPQPPANQPNLAEFAAANFGPNFSLVNRYPLLLGDLDGDGTEDAIFVLTRKDSPLSDELAFHYKVIDPYDEYFGWGDPKVTITFNAHDPEQVKYIAVVHNWRAATPKAKFLVINLPFEKLSLTHVTVKKKSVAALSAEELGGLTSSIHWDGKKYRWEASGVPD